MSQSFIDLAWWVSFVDIPAMAGLLLLIWRTRRENENALNHTREIIDTRNNQMREALSGFKLEAAKSYASVADMKELETRLVSHLLRIEGKLDRTTIKAEVLHAEQKRQDS